MQGAVEPAIAAAVEQVTDDLARTGRDRCGARQARNKPAGHDSEAMTNEDIRRAVEEVAADALREGRACLRLVEWGVELSPKNGSACPVSFEVQSEDEVSLYVGRYGTTVDIYDPDPGSLLATLKEYVTAIIEGRYEEEVRLAETQENMLGKARGVFHLDRGDQEHRYSYVASWGRRGPWQRLTYAAY